MIEIMREENLDAEIERIKEDGGTILRTLMTNGTKNVAIVDASMGSRLKEVFPGGEWEEIFSEKVKRDAFLEISKHVSGSLSVFVAMH